MVDADRRPTRQRVLLDIWAALLTLLVVWPTLRAGQLLARDLVFTPHPPLRPESFGAGGGAPRAVPLDAVVAILSAPVGGDLVGRVAIAGALIMAGTFAHRLCSGLGLAPRALVAGLAIWNPFVLERLALGQWALVMAYAALFPIAVRARAVVAGRSSPWALGPWVLPAALTPTGALLAAGFVVCTTWGRGRRRAVLLLAALAQLPWVMPVMLGAAGATTSTEGFRAFAARSERAGGTLWSLVGLGGIWDGGSVPDSRAGLLGHLTTLLVLAALGFALSRHRSNRSCPQLGTGLWIAGAGSLCLAWLPAVGGGSPRIDWALGAVPGLGLLRDSQKWLAPFVVLSVLAIGCAAQAVLDHVPQRHREVAPALGVLLAVSPLLLLPDGGVRAWRTLTPAQTPAVVARIAEAVQGSEQGLVTAPPRSYRRFDWTAHRLAVYDPASRWFDVPVITSDELVVGRLTLPGEDPRARSVAAAWAAPDPAEALRRLGVGWVVGYRDDPGAATVPTQHWPVVLATAEMQLWQVPPADGATTSTAASSPRLNGFDPPGWRAPGTLVIILLDTLVLLTLAAGGRRSTHRRAAARRSVDSQ